MKTFGKIMIYFDCPECKCYSKSKVALKDLVLTSIPATCDVCNKKVEVVNGEEKK